MASLDQEGIAMYVYLKKFYLGIRILGHDLKRNDMFKQASAMAYITLFSLVPSLAAIFTLISIFRPFLGEQNQLMVQVKEFILQNLAAGSGEQVVKYLDTFLANLDLKKIGISSFAGLLITLLLLLRQIEEALNSVWMVHKGRSIFRRFFYFWAFLTLGAFILSIVVGLSSGFNFENLLSFQDSVKGGRSILSGLSTFLGGVAFFFLLYKTVPNTSVALKEALIGACVSSFLFQQASRFYGIYIKSFTNYQSLYGALAALPLFLFWLYICWLIILFGAVLAWRVGEGFHFEDKKDYLDDLLKRENFLASSHFKALIPFFITLEVYRRFLEGGGKGRTYHELASGLKVPLDWVHDSVESLIRTGLMVASKHSTPDSKSGDEDELGIELFPAFPATNIKVSDIVGMITASTAQWMGTWQSEFPLDFPKALLLLAHAERKKILDESVNEFITRIVMPVKESVHAN